ncbi:hypothetical protein BgiBS90_036850 [Biomphalaria glabrata]|nr:hypothetical protein BgiBS90_036850 [Biomphalaria glabrata]
MFEMPLRLCVPHPVSAYDVTYTSAPFLEYLGEEGVTKKLKLVEAELAKLKIKYAELEHSQEIKNKQLKQAKDNRKMALNKKDQTQQ